MRMLEVAGAGAALILAIACSQRGTGSAEFTTVSARVRDYATFPFCERMPPPAYGWACPERLYEEFAPDPTYQRNIALSVSKSEKTLGSPGSDDFVQSFQRAAAGAEALIWNRPPVEEGWPPLDGSELEKALVALRAIYSHNDIVPILHGNPWDVSRDAAAGEAIFAAVHLEGPAAADGTRDLGLKEYGFTLAERDSPTVENGMFYGLTDHAWPVALAAMAEAIARIRGTVCDAARKQYHLGRLAYWLAVAMPWSGGNWGTFFAVVCAGRRFLGLKLISSEELDRLFLLARGWWHALGIYSEWEKQTPEWRLALESTQLYLRPRTPSR